MPNFFVTIISKPVPHVLRHLSHVQFFAMTEVTEHAWPGLEMTVQHLTVNREEEEKERGTRRGGRKETRGKGKRKLQKGVRSTMFWALVVTCSSPLAWKIPRMEEPGRLQSMGSLGVGQD